MQNLLQNDKNNTLDLSIIVTPYYNREVYDRDREVYKVTTIIEKSIKFL